ncbi:MAG: sigma 54-interacting transcriptional regulator [Myxococcales bacterium]|nr:sigma 54-interacting transcriptional regulator [Myxococcales bacterium]
MTLVVYDDEHPAAAARVVVLPDEGKLAIGRSRSADIVIDSERVSRIHAVFSRHGLEILVDDAASRNGTYVNGELIAGPRRLASGDEVRVGSASVVVGITAGTAARPRLDSTRFLDERLAAEVDRGLCFHRTFGLALIALRGHPEQIDAATDEISASLRPMEAIAEYAPGVLAIVMPELDAAASERAVAGLIQKLDPAEREISVSVGVAAFPEHATTPAALIARALAALEVVRRRGDGGGVARPPEDTPADLGAIVIADPKMQRIHEHLRKVAEHSITVLVRGETGVGKEVIAAAIHAASDRRRGPLIRINCASLPESLLESELFGHERGAFTGADRRKTGFFEAAHGGTLFLDEIGEMTPALQAKLLRVLEQRKITRVGGVEEIAVDARVICATHRDLELECKRGTFRSDLFFRISAFTIVVPPLRDRSSEIEQLARAFIQGAAQQLRRPPPALSPAALHALRRYSWPGNVRELRNAIERAMVLHQGSTIGLEDLPDAIREIRAEATAPAAAVDGPRDIRIHLADLEREAISSALDAAGGNQTEAAKQLGISRRTLIYRMEKYGLKPLPPAKREAQG